MNSNQKSISSKHRTGGGVGGGQSQGNQRGDYQRSNQERYQSHGIRTNNTNIQQHGTVQNIQQQQACMNAMNQSTLPNSIGPQPQQLIRSFPTNQTTQPAAILHQSQAMLSHINSQQQQSTGGGGGPSPQVMSDIYGASTAQQQQRFQSFVQHAPPPQQQQRFSTMRHVRPGGGVGGAAAGQNNTGAGNGGIAGGNTGGSHLQNNLYPPNTFQQYVSSYQNSFPNQFSVPQQFYTFPQFIYLSDVNSRYASPYTIPPTDPTAALNNQAIKTNDVQHHHPHHHHHQHHPHTHQQTSQQQQQTPQQPGNIGQQQLQHQQPPMPMPTQSQPPNKREKKPLIIYNDRGEEINLEQLAIDSKNKQPIAESNNDNDTPNDNRSKADKNADNNTNTSNNKSIKTESMNGPTQINEIKSDTTGDSSDNNNKNADNENEINNSGSSTTTTTTQSSSAIDNNNKLNEEQTTTTATSPTTPTSESSSMNTDGGNHQKTSCDINNETTTDLSSSISEQKQSNEIDDLTDKVKQIALNKDDDNNTIKGDSVANNNVDNNNDTVDHAIKESSLQDNNNNNNNTTSSSDQIIDDQSVTTNQEKKLSTTTGDMENSFEIIDPITINNDNNTTTTKNEMIIDNHSQDTPNDVDVDSSKNVDNDNNNNEIVNNINNNDNDDQNNNNNDSSIDTSRQYSRDELWKLRMNASEIDLSNSNQQNVLDIIRKVSNDKNANTDSLLPPYARQNRQMNDYNINNLQQQYRNKSMIQQSRRPSQTSRNLDPKMRKIASTSLNADHQTTFYSDEWRPGKIQSSDPNEIETENLLKSVRSILNKLTPQNYQILLDQFKALKIDSKSRLEKIIDLIFDKAVAEPAFVKQYAGFCSELIHIKVTEENDNVQVKFKNLLITKCQNTFYDEMYSNIRDLIKECETTEEPEKRKQLSELVEDKKYQSRKRSIGNIKLIAELFKLNMLNASIMFTCFNYLFKHFLDHNNEEYIECLCALITNIGKAITEQINKKFTENIPKFEKLFSDLEKLRNDQLEQKVSPRIRFMILDLLDLRKDNWVPRRKTEGPKSISEVHADFEEQQRMKIESVNEMKKRQKFQQMHQQQHLHQQQQQQYQQLQQQQQQNNAQNNDEWQQVNKRKSQLANVQQKTMNFAVFKNITSGTKNESGLSFSIFTTGSHGGSTSGSQSRSSSTNYENKNSNSSSSNQRTFHDSLNAKNYTRGGRDERKISDVTNYKMDKQHRSDSQQSLKSSSSITARSSPTPRSDSMDNLRSSSSSASASASVSANLIVPELSSEKFHEKIKKVMMEYLNTENFVDSHKEVQLFCSKTKCADFIAESILIVIEKTSQEYNPRERWGKFLGQFFCSSFCENNDIFESLKTVFAQYEDIRVDLPNFFQFVAEIIAHASLIIYEKDTSNAMKNDIIKAVAKAYNEISGSECALFRDHLLKLIEQKNKKCFEEIRKHFHSAQQDDLLFKYDKLGDIMDKYMTNNLDLNQLKSSIKENVSNNEFDEKFKSALYYKILYAGFKNHKNTFNDSAILEKIKNLIKTFVNNNDDEILFLMKCITLFEELNQPQNLLPEIFNFLHENKLIKNESFYEWSQHREKYTIAFLTVSRFMETSLNIK